MTGTREHAMEVLAGAGFVKDGKHLRAWEDGAQQAVDAAKSRRVRCPQQRR
jgi:hypothetical protein